MLCKRILIRNVTKENAQPDLQWELYIDDLSTHATHGARMNINTFMHTYTYTYTHKHC